MCFDQRPPLREGHGTCFFPPFPSEIQREIQQAAGGSFPHLLVRGALSWLRIFAAENFVNAVILKMTKAAS
jgi:hypothetical protein